MQQPNKNNASSRTYLSEKQIELLQKPAFYYTKYLNNKMLYFIYNENNEIKMQHVSFTASAFFHLVGVKLASKKIDAHTTLKILNDDFKENHKNKTANKQAKAVNRLSRYIFVKSTDSNGKSWFDEKNIACNKVFKEIASFKQISKSISSTFTYFVENNNHCLGVKFSEKEDLKFPKTLRTENLENIKGKLCSKNIAPILVTFSEDKSTGRWKEINFSEKIKENEYRKIVDFFNKTTNIPNLTQEQKNRIFSVSQKNKIDEKIKKEVYEVKQYIKKLNNRQEFEKAAVINELWQESGCTKSLTCLKNEYEEVKQNNMVFHDDQVSEKIDCIEDFYNSYTSRVCGVDIYNAEHLNKEQISSFIKEKFPDSSNRPQQLCFSRNDKNTYIVSQNGKIKKYSLQKQNDSKYSNPQHDSIKSSLECSAPYKDKSRNTKKGR